MKTRCIPGRLNLLVAIAVCGIAMLALPQKAHAFLGMQCPFEKNELLTGALKVVGQQTGEKIAVVNSKGMIVATSMCCKGTAQCPKKGAQTAQQCKKMDGKKCAKVDCAELNQTLKDGKTRKVTKTCPKSNKKITATVTALRNAKGQIIGAVITAPKQS